MPIKFLKDGQSTIPLDTENLRSFCAKTPQELVMEWSEGQYLLHSDIPGEKPIGIEIDQELSRHVDYFKKSSIHKEVLARAIGIKGGVRPKVLDLTAGLLGDSLLFLSMGCEVIACERHPVVAFLIKSALEKATHPLLSKFTFREVEGLLVLEEAPQVDVVFFDPMFEDPNQKSYPRKEMRIFRSLVGEDADSVEVFHKAQAIGARRLVIKRPRHSIPVVPGVPLQYLGKATRYDVYLSQNNGLIGSNNIK